MYKINTSYKSYMCIVIYIFKYTFLVFVSLKILWQPHLVLCVGFNLGSPLGAGVQRLWFLLLGLLIWWLFFILCSKCSLISWGCVPHCPDLNRSRPCQMGCMGFLKHFSSPLVCVCPLSNNSLDASFLWVPLKPWAHALIEEPSQVSVF